MIFKTPKNQKNIFFLYKGQPYLQTSCTGGLSNIFFLKMTIFGFICAQSILLRGGPSHFIFTHPPIIGRAAPRELHGGGPGLLNNPLKLIFCKFLQGQMVALRDSILFPLSLSLPKLTSPHYVTSCIDSHQVKQ